VQDILQKAKNDFQKKIEANIKNMNRNYTAVKPYAEEKKAANEG